MAINYTSLLGLAQPVTGTEAGTWGTVVNDQITALLEEAVAGTASLDVTSGDITLSTTTGATNQARDAILLITGTPGVSRNINAPKSSKMYVVINNSNSAVIVRGGPSTPTTGITIASGTRELIAWNGSDFVRVGGIGDVVGPSSATDSFLAAFDGTTGKLIKQITTGAGVVSALGNAVNTSNGAVTQTAALTASALLLGGGSGTGISSTTTGSGVVTAVGNAVNTAGGLVTQSGALTASAILLGGGSGTAISSTTTGTGVVTALGNAADASGGFTTTTGTATLSNKTITQRVSSTSSISSPLVWNSDNFDLYEATAQAADLTINADAGTPTDARKIVFRITSDATPRTITFVGGVNKSFKPIGVLLAVSGSDFTYLLTASKTTYFGAIYNTAVARWEVIALSQEV